MRKAFAVLFLVFMLCGCYELPDCLINNTNMMKVALKSKTDGSATEVAFTSIHIVNLNVNIYENQTVASLQLPLDPNQTETTIVFNYDTKSDTLVVNYRNETRLINPSCGAYLYQKDLNVSASNFDDVRIINNSLLQEVTTNLEIFF